LQELSRREREKLSRRNEILQSARKVFAEKGYDNATVDDVATNAELSKGTIYLYFQNKADLFMSTLEMGMEQFSLIIQESISENKDDPISGIMDIVQRQLSYCEDNIDIFKLVASDSIQIELHSNMGRNYEFKLKIMDTMGQSIATLADYIQYGIDIGIFRRVNPRDSAFALLSIIRGFAFSWMMNPEDIKLKDKSELILTIFLDGLRGENVTSLIKNGGKG